MAINNSLSYTRFTALPANISDFGQTQEEIALSRGTPDANPTLNPMASPKVPEARLALAPQGSDKLRLTQPEDPEFNPYEGAKPALVLTRNAVRKLQGNVLNQLHNLIESVPDNTLQDRMEDSLRRVVGLRESIARLNDMAELVMVRTRAESKG